LQLIRRLTKSSEGENLAPYVYQIKQNGHKVYYPLFYSHPGYDLINIKSKNYKRYLSIEVFSVKEKTLDLPDAPRNLNYEYNKSLHLYSLHRLLIILSTRVFNLKPI
jgi:cystathionine beta-lyase/cystathionine gamma-synthase